MLQSINYMSAAAEMRRLTEPELPSAQHETIAILDAGAQYGKVIDRRIRNLNVYTEILPINTPWEVLKNYKGIIISGGPKSVYAEDSPQCDPQIFKENDSVPILGICYGQQLMAYNMGGKVEKPPERQDGPSEIDIISDSILFKGLEKRQTVLMSHGDSVIEIPEGFTATATCEGLIAAMENPNRKFYATQFHPETDVTKNGKEMLHKFLYDVCGCTGDYTAENREEEAIRYIRETVGEKPVLALLSGGVDSTVLAVLLAKALKQEQIHFIHIDNGFMRKDESEQVKEALEKQGIKLEVIDGSQEFYAAVGDSVDPEFKRKAIGDTFIEIAQQVMKDRGFDPQTMFLAQGTLRPDLIESGSKIASGKADTIKTHHNDSPLAREFRENHHLIEPLKDYHKDEVRELGEMLGLPEELVWRQPFPGPGNSIRIICTERSYRTPEIALVNKLQKFGSEDLSVTLLPTRTVGVQGDERSYSNLVALSGADDWDSLFEIARKIPRTVHGVNRVVYVFGDKIDKPALSTMTPTHLNMPEARDQQKEADHIVNQVLLKYDLVRKLSQVPVISFPVDFGETGKRSIAVRTFITNDFMTGVPAVPGSEYMPKEALEEMVSRILEEVPGVARVVYDLTSKPPGTTEWE